jgi:hypothetical protein
MHYNISSYISFQTKGRELNYININHQGKLILHAYIIYICMSQLPYDSQEREVTNTENN